MEYDLSNLANASSYDPFCYIPSGYNTGTILFGDTSTIYEQVPVVLQDGVALATSNPSIYTDSTPSYCINVNTLIHDEWVSIAFPLISLFIILFSLSMIYHIIFKRLMP